MALLAPARPPTLRRVALAFLVCAAAAAQAAAIHVRVIGINDFHGNLEPATLSLTLIDPADGKPLAVPAGGAPALAGLVHALRAGADHSLMISAGDLVGASPLASTLFRHESTVDVMNAIGLEVNAVGNHEFDAGFAELQRLAKGGCAAQTGPTVSCRKGAYAGAKFPFVASNVLDAGGQPVLAPYIIKRYGGVKLAVIGAVTKTTPAIVAPSGVQGLSFEDEAEAVNRTARKLLAMGVRSMIAVFHEGGEIGTPEQRIDWNDTSCPGARGPIFDLARRLVPEIRVVFTGHTHQGYRCEVEGRLLVQGTSYGRGVSVVDIALDSKTGRLFDAATRSINLPVLNGRSDPAVRERLAASLAKPYARALRKARDDPAIASRVAMYTQLAAPISQRSIGTIAATFHRGGGPDSEAGRLIADAQLAATRDAAHGGAVLALTNPGGIRSDLECNATPPCAVTFGQAFTMQPFGNSLVVMTLTGSQIRALLESQRTGAGGDLIFLQPSEGVTYTWVTDAPTGEHVRNLKLDGRPVEPDTRYRVTVNGFLAQGGDGFGVLRQGGERVGGMLELDALVDYFKGVGVVAPSSGKRISLQ